MSDFNIYDKTIAEIIASQDEADTQYKKVGDASTTNCDINQTVTQIPNMDVIRNKGGEVIGYDYKYTTPKLPDIGIIEIDSNTDSGEYDTKGSTRKYIGTVETDPQSTDKLKGGGFISSLISSTYAGVSALAKFGKNVMSDTGDALATLTENFGRNFGNLCVDVANITADGIRALFGVDSNGNTTMYLEEDVIGALAIQSRDDGFFERGAEYCNPTMPDSTHLTGPVMIYDFGTPERKRGSNMSKYALVSQLICTRPDGYKTQLGVYENSTYQPDYTKIKLFSIVTSTGSGAIYAAYDSTGISSTPTASVYNKTLNLMNDATEGRYTRDNKTVVYWGSGFSSGGSTIFPESPRQETTPTNYIENIAWCVIFGSEQGQSIPGVSDQTGATIPVDAITGADPHVVAQNLETQYPALMGTPVLINVMDDSCNEVTKKYYSVPISYSPTNLNVIAPITGGLQLSPSFNPDVALDLPDIDLQNYVDQIIKIIDGSGAGRGITIEPTINVTPETPLGPDTPSKDIPEGTLPVVIPQTGTGDTPEWTPDTVVSNIHLWSVYMCTPAQLETFSKWLWIDSNIVNDLKRIVQNPMDAILGLHKIYVTPTYGNGTIVVGNIDTQVGAFPVTNQYKSLNCGNVWLTEYFGNVFDYEPYTEISLYLPFIGIVSLSPTDVMRGEMQIQYTVDVYTGACIAEVSVYRDGVGGVLYQYDGNCAVEYPITSVSYNNALSMAMGIASGVIGATGSVLSDNPLGAVSSLVRGVSSGVLGRRTNISRSGGFSGNAGAMGSKKPYLIISRPMPQTPEDFEAIEGYSSNQTIEIGNTSGYIECRHVVLEIGGAYKSEIDEIMQYLHTGIYV